MTASIRRVLVCAAMVLLPEGILRAQTPPAPVKGVPAEISQAVTAILRQGFSRPLIPSAELERTYQQAVQSAGSADPCLMYAQAIVLAKNGQAEAGEALLRQVSESDSSARFLAREDVCLRQLRGEMDYALTRSLIDLAKQIGAVEPHDRDAQVARNSAVYVGRMNGFLLLPSGTSEVLAFAGDADVQIETWIGPAYLTAYHQGRDAVTKEYRDLQSEIASRITEKELKLDQQAQDAQAKAARAKSSRQQLEQENEDIQALFKEASGDLTSRSEALERHFYSSLEAEQRLLATQTILQRELDQLRTQFNNSTTGQRGNSPRQRQQLEQAIQAREAEMLGLTADHALLLQGRTSLTQLAAEVASQHQTFNSGAGQALRDKQTVLNQLDAWQKKYETAAAKKAEAIAADDPAIKSLKRRATEWSTYVRKTPADQRDQLEKLLGVAQ